jgi:hypothetical protein
VETLIKDQNPRAEPSKATDRTSSMVPMIRREKDLEVPVFGMTALSNIDEYLF